MQSWKDRLGQCVEKYLGQEWLRIMEPKLKLELRSCAPAPQTKLGLSVGKMDLISSRKFDLILTCSKISLFFF